MKRAHDLKTWPEPWEATRAGLKPFEFRLDDRGYAVGDLLRLCKWDPGPHGGYLDHRGCVVDGAALCAYLLVEVTYILTGRHGVPVGYVVMGIKMVETTQ